MKASTLFHQLTPDDEPAPATSVSTPPPLARRFPKLPGTCSKLRHRGIGVDFVLGSSRDGPSSPRDRARFLGSESKGGSSLSFNHKGVGESGVTDDVLPSNARVFAEEGTALELTERGCSDSALSSAT